MKRDWSRVARCRSGAEVDERRLRTRVETREAEEIVKSGSVKGSNSTEVIFTD